MNRLLRSSRDAESTAPGQGLDTTTGLTGADITPNKAQPQYSVSSRETAKLDPKSKRAKVLRVFLEQGDNGLTCFQAVELARDYVLRTTVSEIQRHLRITFHKAPHSFTNPGGSITTCTRYWLTLEGAAKARELLSEATAPAMPKLSAALPTMDKARWDRAVRAAEQERRDRAARRSA